MGYPCEKGPKKDETCLTWTIKWIGQDPKERPHEKARGAERQDVPGEDIRSERVAEHEKARSKRSLKECQSCGKKSYVHDDSRWWVDLAMCSCGAWFDKRADASARKNLP